MTPEENRKRLNRLRNEEEIRQGLSWGNHADGRDKGQLRLHNSTEILWIKSQGRLK